MVEMLVIVAFVVLKRLSELAVVSARRPRLKAMAEIVPIPAPSEASIPQPKGGICYLLAETRIRR